MFGWLKKKSVTRDDICSSLRSSAKSYLRQVAKAHSGETLYAFLFEISCEGFSAHGAVATEEGLARYAQAQLAKVRPIKTADLLATLRSCFRWAGPEDGWYQQPDSAFDAVNELLSRAEAEGLYETYDGSLNELCLKVLQEMDQAGLFGVGQERERVVLGICYIGGDNSDEEFLGWAKQVNSPGVMQRLQQELKQSRKDSERVTYF
jgi:hypothetical protein